MKEIKYVLIIHEVEDYLKWKSIFDRSSEIRCEAGEVFYQLFCYENNKANVVHLSSWHSHDQAKCFFESEELIKIRYEAGVKQPTFIYLNELERGIL